MRDTSGSKTVALVLAIVVAGTIVYSLQQTRQDASAGQRIRIDATTHGDQVAQAIRQMQGRSTPARPRGTTAPGGKSAGVVNKALREMETFEETQRTVGDQWRSKPGDPGRLDDWRP